MEYAVVDKSKKKKRKDDKKQKVTIYVRIKIRTLIFY